MKPFVKNLIELQQEIPYAVEIVTEEFFEDEKSSHSFFDYGGA
jgi:GTPase Era involved in 16S rRNA processing